jgi:sugar O-acyltransferase (sialic acid O-acetyltransferase NeuD family)
MKNGLVIIGAGGHGQVVADTADAAGFADIMFVDERTDVPDTIFPLLGNLDALLSQDPNGRSVVVAIGDAQTRLHLLDRAERAGFVLATIIHPRAIVSPRASLDEGTVVFAGAVVQALAHVGRGTILNTSCTVDHHARLARGVHVCPGANLAGHVTIGAHSWIGIGAAVRQGIVIGKDVTVGAGAAVIADVPDGVTVVGVPARARV